MLLWAKCGQFPVNMLHNSNIKLQALVYDILPSRRKVPESGARSAQQHDQMHALATICAEQIFTNAPKTEDRAFLI